MWRLVRSVVTVLLPIAAWVGIKHGVDVSDRYLPGPLGVWEAVTELGAQVLVDTAHTYARVFVSFILGLLFGVLSALYCHRIAVLEIITPTVNALRAVPPIAMVPFFLLWFGFSDLGKVVLLTLGLGLNIFVAVADKLENQTEEELIMFSSFGISSRRMVWSYWFYATLETLLPTLRFGLAMAIGVAIVAEMLGSQSGLGHRIQIARTTYSLNVIFLAAGILGLLSVLADRLLVAAWRALIYWRL